MLKDLSTLHGLDLSRTVLVDNSVISMAPQLDNGIPFKSFNATAQESEDEELVNLVKFVEGIFANYSDIRVPIAQHFQLSNLVKYLGEEEAEEEQEMLAEDKCEESKSG